MQKNGKRSSPVQEKLLRLACYTGNLTMALVGALSPLLFLTFRETYGIS